MILKGKTALILILVIITVITCATVVGVANLKGVSCAINSDVKLAFDGVVTKFNTTEGYNIPTLMYSGRAFVPLAPLCEKLGLAVTWDDKTSTINITSKNNEENVAILESGDEENKIKLNSIGTVKLKGNATTGYTWNYTISDQDVIELDSKSFESQDLNLVGSPRNYIWNFKPIKTGTTKITFKYYRPWEGPQTAGDTKEFNISVEE